MQVDQIKPPLKAPGTTRWKLKCDILLSNFALKLHLRHYNEGNPWLALIEATCIVVFTIEYVAKFITAPNRYQYFTGGATQLPTARPPDRPTARPPDPPTARPSDRGRHL